MALIFALKRWGNVEETSSLEGVGGFGWLMFEECQELSWFGFFRFRGVGGV